MKKKLVLLLLAGIMMFGTCTSVYAANQYLSGLDCKFAASSDVIYTKSTTSIWYAHVHDYSLNIKAYKSANSSYAVVPGVYSYNTWDDEFVTTVEPSVYNLNSYIGKKFTGKQVVIASIPETGDAETHIFQIN